MDQAVSQKLGIKPRQVDHSHLLHVWILPNRLEYLLVLSVLQVYLQIILVVCLHQKNDADPVTIVAQGLVQLPRGYIHQVSIVKHQYDRRLILRVFVLTVQLTRLVLVVKRHQTADVFLLSDHQLHKVGQNFNDCLSIFAAVVWPSDEWMILEEFVLISRFNRYDCLSTLIVFA